MAHEHGPTADDILAGVREARELLEYVAADSPWLSPGSETLERHCSFLRARVAEGRPLVAEGLPFDEALFVYDRVIERLAAHERGHHPRGRMVPRGGELVPIRMVESAIAKLIAWEDEQG